MAFKSACFGAAVTAISLFLGPQSAGADLLLFTITGTIGATFTLDSNATPSSTDSDGAPTFLNVSGTLDGGAITFAEVTFFDGVHSGGGLLLWEPPDLFFLNLINGPQVYSNTPPPLFAPGTFTYTNENSRDLRGDGCRPRPDRRCWTSRCRPRVRRIATVDASAQDCDGGLTISPCQSYML